MINEIWEGLRLLPFFSSPKRGFYDGKRGFRILATRRPTPGQGWPLLLLRTSRRPCRQAAGHKARRPAVPVRGYRPCGVVCPRGRGQTKKECASVAIVRLAPGDSPPGFGRRWPGGCGGWWCAAGPAAGRRGLRRPVAAAPVARGRPPPAQVVGNKGPGLRGGAPQPPGGRVGGVPPVVLFGLVPGRRFALAPPSPRGRKGGRARRPAPLGSICGPGRGGLDSAACGRRGTAGAINAPGWWIANERHP